MTKEEYSKWRLEVGQVGLPCINSIFLKQTLESLSSVEMFYRVCGDYLKWYKVWLEFWQERVIDRYKEES